MKTLPLCLKCFLPIWAKNEMAIIVFKIVEPNWILGKEKEKTVKFNEACDWIDENNISFEEEELIFESGQRSPAFFRTFILEFEDEKMAIMFKMLFADLIEE